MSVRAITSADAYMALKKIFNFPDEVVELHLYLKVDEPARMELLLNVTENGFLTGEKELKKYKLMELDEDEC